MGERISDIVKLLPKDQFDEVMGQEYCDIEPIFMGFTDTYKALASVIPEHFTIVDLGCAYNPQCFYFTKHKGYIAVDASGCKKFHSDNCVMYTMTIQRYITEHLKDLDLDTTFAICSYVPLSKTNMLLVRQSFPNLFVYYPD